VCGQYAARPERAATLIIRRTVEWCVISIRPGAGRAIHEGREGRWAAIIAVAMTCASFTAVSLALRAPASWMTGAPQATSTPERMVLFLLPPEPSTLVEQPPVPRTPAAHAVQALAHEMTRAEPNSARDTVTAPAVTPAATPALPGASNVLSPRPTRLLPDRPVVPWYSFPEPRAPLGAARAMTKEERDSALDVMSAMIQDLAAARAPTQGERDAAAKEAMLKMRNSGRILLVPPDNTGGLITLPLPLFSPGPSKARRARDSKAFDENRARLERLRLRADSARRARGDSLPR
jgi:hypothetical protein